MIKVVIIEDEAPARKKLKRYLEKLDEVVDVVKEIETVYETEIFLKTSPDIDVIFSDIELRDGNVFDVYNQINVDFPIIFATAYDQFWMNAFETSGIEYLLKPYSYSRFEKAWKKYLALINKKEVDHNDIFKRLDAYYQAKVNIKPAYKDYISVKSNNNEIYFLKVADIMFLQSDYGVVFAVDERNKKHLLNQGTLKELEELLNPTEFFKINRSEIINRVFVEKISRYTKNTIAIHIKSHVLKTSQSNTSAFNSWMGL
ncbi:LytTR family DNA-binding domain-containing protein [uncultured Tenacibaculum sp.]|uniref:LytR/AlgR family response regulator transcription factor n=1 Tax=uncultured Tenacibaculum sp. TaxID=174713 RepID=UPI0026345B2B|nr:LytTR family DNA-binding domain-containing protein [uncultured Tenacibaculum sp.]